MDTEIGPQVSYSTENLQGNRVQKLQSNSEVGRLAVTWAAIGGPPSNLVVCKESMEKQLCSAKAVVRKFARDGPVS